jgi:hypothetical protein
MIYWGTKQEYGCLQVTPAFACRTPDGDSLFIFMSSQDEPMCSTVTLWNTWFRLFCHLRIVGTKED